jgi:peptide/nickel transport system substrate-binding protein
VAACATNFAAQLAPHGFKLRVRRTTFTQTPVQRAHGQFELTAAAAPGESPHPFFAWQNDISTFLPPNTDGPGSGLNVQQQTRAFGTVNLQHLIDQSARGLDVSKQRAVVREMALSYNELVPFLPFVERYGRHPIRPGVRVAGWPALKDPIYLNNPYTDSFAIMMLLTGQLHPV